MVRCPATRWGHGLAAATTHPGAAGGAPLGGGPIAAWGSLSQAGIARELGVSRAAVTHWKQRLARAGTRGLRRRYPPGRAPKRSAAQWRRLLRLLGRGAVAAGVDNERWTLRRIALLIERTFGVQYHFRSLGRLLHAHGWRPQRPLPRARERNEDLIAAWLRRDWPRVNKGLVAQGGHVPSWTRRVTRFGPASARPGRRAGSPRSCGA
jgi:transposase